MNSTSYARTCKNEELQAKLKGAYVFKVGLENGTRSSDPSWSPSIEIGCRMYYQLHPDYLEWESFRSDTKSHVRPNQVLEILAEAEMKELKDMTVIILMVFTRRMLLPSTPYTPPLELRAYLMM